MCFRHLLMPQGLLRSQFTGRETEFQSGQMVYLWPHSQSVIAEAVFEGLTRSSWRSSALTHLTANLWDTGRKVATETVTKWRCGLCLASMKDLCCSHHHYSAAYLITFCLICFLLVLKLELRTLCLQSRCSIAWATLPIHFVLVILEMGVLWTICLPSSQYYRCESIAPSLNGLFLFIYLFIYCETGVWTQCLHLEPLHQTFCEGFFC
jgi:hypothetical protein